MAIQIGITNEKGVVANYHRIIAATQIYKTSDAGIHINLAGYVSKEYRDLEENEILSVTNTAVYLPFADVMDFSLPTLYGRIKEEILEFNDSVNV